MKTFSYLSVVITNPVFVPVVYTTLVTTLLTTRNNKENMKINKEFYTTILMIA
jgi:hypothetical protein